MVQPIHYQVRIYFFCRKMYALRHFLIVFDIQDMSLDL